jgi:hypothetical protein
MQSNISYRREGSKNLCKNPEMHLLDNEAHLPRREEIGHAGLKPEVTTKIGEGPLLLQGGWNLNIEWS